MEENKDNNKVVESNSKPDEIEFVYNFINIPWDDRSNRSKWGIVALLVTIFVVIMACVTNNFIIHYRERDINKIIMSTEINCIRAKVADYNFVARIHLVSSGELLCVGAVISRTSIIANEICTQSGSVRLQLGNPNKHICKKGFSVDVIEPIYRDDVVSSSLVLLSSYEHFARCIEVVNIGLKLNLAGQAQIIGRTLNVDRSLSVQLVSIVGKEDPYIGTSSESLSKGALICAKGLERCPILAGDLIFQKGELFGLAISSVHRPGRTSMVCFADLRIVYRKLKELDTAIGIANSDNETINI